MGVNFRLLTLLRESNFQIKSTASSRVPFPVAIPSTSHASLVQPRLSKSVPIQNRLSTIDQPSFEIAYLHRT